MRDGDIRTALITALAVEHAAEPGTLIRPEMSLNLGACRVDVGLVNGALTGYEIKSPRDNLMRLPSQVEHYGRCLDFAAIVTSGRHAEKIAERVPDWWGVWVADESPHGVRVRSVRELRPNPSVEPFSVAQILWRSEAAQVLRDKGHDRPSARLTRWDLWDLLVDHLTLEDLRAAVRRCLKARSAAAGS